MGVGGRWLLMTSVGPIRKNAHCLTYRLGSRRVPISCAAPSADSDDQVAEPGLALQTESGPAAPGPVDPALRSVISVLHGIPTEPHVLGQPVLGDAGADRSRRRQLDP